MRSSVGAALTAAALIAPAASAGDSVVVTCSIEYPRYASAQGSDYVSDVTGTCTVAGDLPRPAVLTMTAYVGPGCAAASDAAGWIIGADFDFGFTWQRVVDTAFVSLQSPAGTGTGTFGHDDPTKVCGLHQGPATETAVFELTTY